MRSFIIILQHNQNTVNIIALHQLCMYMVVILLNNLIYNDKLILIYNL